MEASSARPRRSSLQDALSTRGGSLALAAIIAVIAALLLVLFVHNYRKGNSATTQSGVLVARSLIARGSSGTLIATEQLAQSTRLPGSQIKAGALTDPTVLRGQAAVTEILPGQQLVAADFGPSTGGVIDRLSGNQRAVAVPVDATHGLSGNVQAGDHVDVFASFGGNAGGGVVHTLLQNALVLQPPTGSSGSVGSSNGGSSIILQVTDQQALSLAYTADFGKVWIVLRPGTGAQQGPPSSATQSTVLAGH
jgi:pilus assembly protein CpaB